MEYCGTAACRCLRPKVVVRNEGAPETSDFSRYSVDKKTEDDVVVEFSFRKISSSSLSGKKKLTLYLETEDLPDDRNANDVYSWAQRFVSIVAIEHGELYKEFDIARKERNAACDKKMKEKEEKDAKDAAEKQKILNEEREKLEREKMKREKEDLREEEMYQDDKVLRHLARQEVIKERELTTFDQEEKLALKAVERKLLDARKVVVREKCNCTVLTTAAKSGFFNKKPSATSGWSASDAGQTVGCSICHPTAGTSIAISGTFTVGGVEKKTQEEA